MKTERELEQFEKDLILQTQRITENAEEDFKKIEEENKLIEYQQEKALQETKRSA